MITQLCKYVKLERLPESSLVIKEGSSGNLKVYYLVDGKVSIFVNREIAWSKVERMDFIAFETVYQLYLLMRAVHIAPYTIKQEIVKLWKTIEKDREEYIKALISAGTWAPLKARQSIATFLKPTQSLNSTKSKGEAKDNPVEEQKNESENEEKELKVEKTEEKKEIKETTTKSALPSMKELMAIGLQEKIFQASGTITKDGWYKLSSEFKSSALYKFKTYSLIDTIAPFMDDKTKTKIRFQYENFKNPYKMTDIELDWLFSQEDNQKPFFSNCLNTIFMDLASNIGARIDLINGCLDANSRLPPLLYKRLLGLNVRTLEGGEVFGERALESKGARTASAMTESRCV